MRTALFICIFFSAFLFLLSGCAVGEEGPSPQTGSAARLPLLAEGRFPGMIIGFNPSNPPETAGSIETRWQEALQAGMRVGRLQIDWDELEPNRSEYDTDVLEDLLKEYHQDDLQTFLLISVYDSEGPVLPEYLQGLSLDDPELIHRFKKLMDWVIPMLIDYGGYLISVSNEADNSFGEIPGLHEEVLTFLKEARRYIHGIDDRIAVTATIAEGNIGIGKPGIQALIDECDAACFNFYGAKAVAEFPYAEPQEESEIRGDIERMLEVSGSKQIVIQELGMWSGSNLLSSSEEIQRRFFEIFFEEMAKHERIRAVYVFQLVDWSPEAGAVFVELLSAEGLPEDFVNAFIEMLETIGLIRYEDGRPRPGWDEFVRWVKHFSESRVH